MAELIILARSGATCWQRRQEQVSLRLSYHSAAERRLSSIFAPSCATECDGCYVGFAGEGFIAVGADKFWLFSDGVGEDFSVATGAAIVIRRHVVLRLVS